MKRVQEGSFQSESSHKQKQSRDERPEFSSTSTEFVVLYTFSARDNKPGELVGPCCRPSEAVTFLRRSVMSTRRTFPSARILIVTETVSRLRSLLVPFDVECWDYADAIRCLRENIPSSAAALETSLDISKYSSSMDIFYTIGHARVWLMPLLMQLMPLATLLYLDDDTGFEKGKSVDAITTYRGPPLAYEIQKSSSVRGTILPHICMAATDTFGEQEIVNNGVILAPPSQEARDALGEVFARFCELRRHWGHLMYWDMIALTGVWHARHLGTVRAAGIPILHFYQHKYRDECKSRMLLALGTWRRELDDQLALWFEEHGQVDRAERIREWSTGFFTEDWPKHLAAAATTPSHIERVDMARLMRSRTAK